MILRNSCFSLLFLMSCGVFSQQTSVIVKSNQEGMLFQANMNNFLLNKTPTNHLKVIGLVPQGKYFLEIKFTNDTNVFKTFINIIDVGFYHLYKVDEKGIHLTKIAPDYEVDEANQLVVKFGEQPIELVDTILKTDSVLTDTTDHYQMVDYKGKIGCPWPLKDDNFGNFKINLNNQHLEDDKLQFAKEFLNQQCLFSKQVADVLLVFEYEETKLDFAKFIYPRTFDIDNFITEIRPRFKFENSLDKLKVDFKVEKKKD